MYKQKLNCYSGFIEFYTSWTKEMFYNMLSLSRFLSVVYFCYHILIPSLEKLFYPPLEIW